MSIEEFPTRERDATPRLSNGMSYQEFQDLESDERNELIEQLRSHREVMDLWALTGEVTEKNKETVRDFELIEHWLQI